jgi:hypothetical protein
MTFVCAAPFAVIEIATYLRTMFKIGLFQKVVMALAIGVPAQLFGQTPEVQGEDLSDQIITGAWADPAKCNVSNARPISFSDAAQASTISKGDCVAVTAYWMGRALFAQVSDADQKKSMVSGALAGRRVGIYANERTLIAAPRRPKPYTVIGVYGSCNTEWQGAFMVLGYCHYANGPFLKVSQTIPAKRRDVR